MFLVDSSPWFLFPIKLGWENSYFIFIKTSNALYPNGSVSDTSQCSSRYSQTSLSRVSKIHNFGFFNSSNAEKSTLSPLNNDFTSSIPIGISLFVLNISQRKGIIMIGG